MGGIGEGYLSLNLEEMYPFALKTFQQHVTVALPYAVGTQRVPESPANSEKSPQRLGNYFQPLHPMGTRLLVIRAGFGNPLGACCKAMQRYHSMSG